MGRKGTPNYRELRIYRNTDKKQYDNILRDSSVYKLVAVQVDYIKAPQYINLTQEQVDLTEDTSLILEFPDNVCHEIINELVTLVMEKTADPRLQTHSIVTLSIVNPVQQLTALPAKLADQ